ncbi:MAG: helix-turn-helix domain-containing protein, partial [Alphaproteobacteria bacterium]|nr:helix-turn-helix domain-containing protein [Alphaproteobacteria bacterium]
MISLFNHLHTGTRESAGLSDLAGATSLPEAQVTAALGTLIARGYVAEQVGPAPGPAQETGHAGATREQRPAGNAPGKRPAGAGGKRPVLDARIMDYELDLD